MSSGKDRRGFQLPSRGWSQGRDTSKIVSDSVIEEGRGRAHGMRGKGLRQRGRGRGRGVDNSIEKG